MNPYMIQRLAAARVRDLRRQAAVSERLRLARRARRGGSTVHRHGIRGRCAMVMLHSRADVARHAEFACLTDPDLFFAESPADIARAKELCRDCPVASACLAGALDRGEPWGVWGGQLVLQGAVVASKRGRGGRAGQKAVRRHRVAS